MLTPPVGRCVLRHSGVYMGFCCWKHVWCFCWYNKNTKAEKFIIFTVIMLYNTPELSKTFSKIERGFHWLFTAPHPSNFKKENKSTIKVKFNPLHFYPSVSSTEDRWFLPHNYVCASDCEWLMLMCGVMYLQTCVNR